MSISFETLALAKDYTNKTIKGAGGLKGEKGDSAYEIAVKNGFEGTEQEWLDSIKVVETVIYVSSEPQVELYNFKKAIEDSIQEVLKSDNKDGALISVMQPFNNGDTTLMGSGFIIDHGDNVWSGSIVFSVPTAITQINIVGAYDFQYIKDTGQLAIEKKIHEYDLNDYVLMSWIEEKMPREREIYWEQYKALSEAEKMNGTTYYVPDAPSYGGGGSESGGNVLDYLINVGLAYKEDEQPTSTDIPLIPSMTDYTSPKGKVTTDTESNWNGFVHYAWRAFNGKETNEVESWGISGVGSKEHFVQYEFDTSIIPKYFEYKTYAPNSYNNGYMAIDFSEDCIVWDVYYKDSMPHWGGHKYIKLLNEKNKAYKFFRLRIYGCLSENPNYIVLPYIQLYGQES